MKAILISVSLIACMLLSGCAEDSNGSNHTDVKQANEVSVEVSIEGMSCMACVAKVKKTISNLNGISKIEVSLKDKNASIRYDSNNISLDTIKHSIDKIGYKTKPAK